MEPSKIRAIQNFDVPKTKKEVCSFLRLTGYHRKVISRYASIANPLTDLTQKSKPSQVQWTLDTRVCCSVQTVERQSMFSSSVANTRL